MADIAFTTEGNATAFFPYEAVYVRLSDASLWLRDSGDGRLTPVRPVQANGLTSGTVNLAAALAAIQNVEPA